MYQFRPIHFVTLFMIYACTLWPSHTCTMSYTSRFNCCMHGITSRRHWLLRTYSLQERSAITNTSDMYTFTDISLYVVKKQAKWVINWCMNIVLREGTCNEMTAPSTTSNWDLDSKCNISFVASMRALCSLWSCDQNSIIGLCHIIIINYCDGNIGRSVICKVLKSNEVYVQ